MMRWTLGTVLIVLAGCKVDFYGDRGEVGFVTSLVTGDRTSWNPGAPIASGSEVYVLPMCVADETREDGQDCDSDIEGQFRAKGGVQTLTRPTEMLGTLFGVVGEDGDRGTVLFETASVRDRFPVRFADPVDVLVRPVGSASIGDVAWAVLDGRETRFDVQLADEDGQRLGYDSEQLWVEVTSPLVADWDSDEGLRVWTDGGVGAVGQLTVGFGDEVVGTIDLRVTTHAAIDGWERRSPDGERVAWVDGWPVAGAVEVSPQ